MKLKVMVVLLCVMLSSFTMGAFAIAAETKPEVKVTGVDAPKWEEEKYYASNVQFDVKPYPQTLNFHENASFKTHVKVNDQLAEGLVNTGKITAHILADGVNAPGAVGYLNIRDMKQGDGSQCLSFDGNDTIELLEGLELPGGNILKANYKYKLLVATKGSAEGSSWVLQEDLSKYEALSIVGIEPIQYSHNGTGAVQGAEGHTAMLNFKFDKALSLKPYNYINGRLASLSGGGVWGACLCETVEEMVELEKKLGDFVNDFVLINGQSLRTLFKKVEGATTALPEPAFAVHLNEDLKGFTLNIDNRNTGARESLLQTVVSGEGDATIRKVAPGNTVEIKAGFRSKFTNVANTKDVKFTYDAENKTWIRANEEFNIIGVNQHGFTHLLSISFNIPTKAYAGIAHTFDFIKNNILINSLTLNEYDRTNNVDMRVNQNANGSWDIWSFVRGTGNASPYADGTVVTIKKGINLMNADGSKLPGYELGQSYQFKLNGLQWEMTKLATSLEITSYSNLTVFDDVITFDINFANEFAPKNTSAEDIMNIIKDYIKINDKKISEYNSVAGTVSATAVGKVLTIKIDKTKLKLDGSDSVEVLEGMTSFDAKLLQGYKKYYNKTLDSWINEAISSTLTEHDVVIKGISPFTESSGNPIFTITFDKEISNKTLLHYNGTIAWHEAGATASFGIDKVDILKMKVQPAWAGLQDGISFTYTPIGKTAQITKTIREISADAKLQGEDENVAFMAHMRTNSIDLSWQGASKLAVDFDKEVIINIDKNVFVTPNGGKLASDYRKIYSSEFKGWFNDGEVPEWTETRVKGMNYLLPGTGYWSIQIALKDTMTLGDIHMMNVQNNKNITDNIILNGKTFTWIIENAKKSDGSAIDSPIVIHLLPEVYTGPTAVGKTIMHLNVNMDIPVEMGGIVHLNNVPETGKNSVVIKKGLRTPSVHIVDKDYEFIYKNGWAEVIDTSGIVWEEVELLSVSAPEIQAEGNVRFQLHFNKAIAHKPLLHINAPVSWLNAVSQSENAPFYYSEAELAVLSAYGILEGFGTKIMFNGVLLEQLVAKETNPAQAPVTIMIHIGSGGDLSVMDISFAGKSGDGDGANKISDFNQPFEFKILAGFKTSMIGEIKEDVTFKYNVETKLFGKVFEGSTSNNAKINEVYYNGNLLVDGAVLKVASKDDLNLKLFTVLLDDSSASYVISGNTGLVEGMNTVTITATAGDKSTTSTFTFKIEVAKKSAKGCGVIGFGGNNNFTGMFTLIALATCVSFIVYRRRAVVISK